MVFKIGPPFNRVFEKPVLILLSMNVFVEFILLYLLYRFIAGFLVPLFRTASQVRKQFHNVNGQPNGQNSPPPNPGGNGTTGSSGSKDAPKPDSTKVGEYIDFEEVK
jgi:hypothetical protein